MSYLVHHGIKGQQWGVRRYQNEDGSLTEAGRERYDGSSSISQPKMARSSNAPIKSSSSIDKKESGVVSTPEQIQTTKASPATQTKLPSSTKTSTQSAGSTKTTESTSKTKTKTGDAKTKSSTKGSSGSKKKKGKKSADKTVKRSGGQKVAHIKQSSSSKNGRSFVVSMSSPKSMIKSSSNGSATSYSSQGNSLIPRGR